MVRQEVLIKSISKLLDLGLNEEEIVNKLSGVGLKKNEVLEAFHALNEKPLEKEEFGLERIDLDEVLEESEEMELPKLRTIPSEPIEKKSRAEELNAFKKELMQAEEKSFSASSNQPNFLELKNQTLELIGLVKELIQLELEKEAKK